MAKKRNRRTRKKYKKRGGFTNDELRECNNRLKSQGVKSRVQRLRMCNDSNATADLDTQEPVQEEPLQQEPVQPSFEDRASALESQLDLANRTKGRKALRTTVGSCRTAVDNGNKYYYNEAGETTDSPPGTEEFDKVCNPTDGIEKTGNKSGNCLGARYKGGPEYWYHEKKQFSTRDPNHPLCHESEPIDVKSKTLDAFPYIEAVIIPKQLEDKKKEAKDELPACDTFNGRTCDLNRCVLEPKKAARKRTKKNPKQLKKKDRLCLDKKIGGKRTKRKKSRKKRRKSRKRRR